MRSQVSPIPIVVVALCLTLVFTSCTGAVRHDDTGDASARSLLSRSIAFHDPDGLWNDGRTIEMTWAGTGDDGEERLKLETTFARQETDSFRMQGHYRGTQIDYTVENDRWRATIDGKPHTELDEPTRQKLALLREDGLFWRNYWGFLAGLPMNLRDPGAQVDPDTERTEFAGRTVDAVRVTYDPRVGNDAWNFYFDPETAELLGCRFTKADPSNPGEYIVFDGLIEADGLRLPQRRRWYVNGDDRYLGDDVIERLAVKP